MTIPTKREARALKGDARVGWMEFLYREQDWTLQRIGDWFGITRSRVQQIFARRGIRAQDRKGFGGKIATLDPDVRASMIQLRLAHWSVADIARRFEFSPSMVSEITAPAVREERAKNKARAKKLYNEHKSSWKVAEIMGVSDQTVLNWLKGVIIPNSARGYSPEIRRKALELRKRNPKMSQKKVAEIVGCSSNIISKWECRGIGQGSRVRHGDQVTAGARAQARRRASARAQRLATKRERMKEAASSAAPDLVRVAKKARPSHEV